jgi:hypothetical protein
VGAAEALGGLVQDGFDGPIRIRDYLTIPKTDHRPPVLDQEHRPPIVISLSAKVMRRMPQP